MNLDEYVKVVGDYADQVAAADRLAQQNTMGVARAMDEVYESGVWVDEWLKQKPEPKRPTARWNPADRNRFIAWQAWKLGQAGRRDVTRVRKWQLLQAARTARSVRALQILHTTEPMQPLFWLWKNQYENRLPDVWSIAVDLAGGDPAAVTSAHTREALARWKHDLFGKRLDGTPRRTTSAINQAAAAAGKARQLHAQIMDNFRELYELTGIDETALAEFRGVLKDLDKFLDDHADTAGAA